MRRTVLSSSDICLLPPGILVAALCAASISLLSAASLIVAAVLRCDALRIILSAVRPRHTVGMVRTVLSCLVVI